MTHHASRRQFLAGSLAAAAFGTRPAADALAQDQAHAHAQEFYELRHYAIENGKKQAIVSGYLENALLPALGRMGIDRVGVFASLDEPDDHSLWVLIPYKRLEQFGSLNATLADDGAYQKAAQELFSQPVKDPAYQRINSRFMKAFAGMPVIEMPEQTADKQPRIFELRTYESHNEDTAARKVEMFNKGEIDVMRDVKMAPVFYGEMLIGDDVPNLTYMLSASDMDAHKKHWDAFRVHPEWIRMKAIPRYKGTVSKITNWFLEPTEYSQI